MQTYEHRQPLARWMTILMAAVSGLVVFLPYAFPHDPDSPWPRALVLAIIAASWWILSELVTRVDASGVSWSFRLRWIGDRIPFEQIARVERTQLNLMERGGAGWHWTVWHGWLWSVGGAEAVEIYTTSGGRTTLGTDDPQGLVDAIERFRKGAA